MNACIFITVLIDRPTGSIRLKRNSDKEEPGMTNVEKRMITATARLINREQKNNKNNR